MHSGSQKPGVYRSSLRGSLLAGCEDTGKAGCGTSRKPKNSATAPMGVSAVGHRGRGDSGSTYTGGWEEESARDCRGNSDLQLLHLSREAQKLNQMIDSWSKSPNFDGRPTGIAADLLRGALDLQESLFMLEKLQEASGFVADARRRNSCDAMEEEMGALGMGLMGSRRFESSSCRVTAQAPRIPVDGSSRNRREELKKVIQTSLHRQNLVTISSDEEKAPSGRSLKLPPRNGFGDAWVEEGHKREGSGSAAAGQKKAKAPNLIARLMGLEEAFSEDLQPTVSSRPERRKNPVQPRQFFDVEMPKASKPPSPEEKPAPERKTLREIIDAVQFKGLLRGERSEEPQARSLAEQYFRWLPAVGEAPPIVIIKPITSAGLEEEEAQRGLYMETNHAPPMQEKGQFSRAVEAAAPRSILPMQLENRVERPVAKDKVEVRCKNNTSASSYLKKLKREMSRMRQEPDEMQRLVPDGGRLESRSVRSVTASGPQTKATSSIPTRNPESRRPVHAKNHVSAQESSSNHVERRSGKPAATRKAMDSAKERKITGTRHAKEPAIPTQVDSPTSSREENIETIPVQEKTISEILSSTLPSNVPPREREQNPVITKRDAGKDSSFHCEVMPKRIHGGGGNPHAARLPDKDTECLIKVPAESTEELKLLLLCSPSFLLHAQELFNIHHHQPADFHRPETKQWTALGGSKLLVDCSTELMASRSRRLELLSHPLSQSSLKRRPEFKISMDRLVDEISEGIENLRSYSGGGDAAKDSLYERLERDLMCKRVFARGAWDGGWIEVVPIEEAEGTLRDVEKLVLNDLIAEAAVELVR
ncbi:hypothetical protein Taro_036941 [Colocasia esculenta]|uniref:DUF3741 domain-containing protein n=1 Tax=Colocasia esculenta TaxID=4460 RepID=A0A843W9S5_COLES|nr:hypothetical protein [Colocasia esculenta]